MLPIGTPVDIYWNLHRDVFSVRSRRSEDYGRVIAHVDSFRLERSFFVVNEAGRQRVLQEKRKNVHAFVRGLWSGDGDVTPGSERVTYNPYFASFFTQPNLFDRGITQSSAAVGIITFGKPQLFAEVS